jgi:hypothetical protein
MIASARPCRPHGHAQPRQHLSPTDPSELGRTTGRDDDEDEDEEGRE